MSSLTFGSTTPFVEPVWYSRGKSPYYNESHKGLRSVVRSYINQRIKSFCAEWEAQGFVPAEVLRQHSLLGYTAAAINPARVANYLGNIKLPGDIDPFEWDGFHDLICIDEIARCGYLGVIWALGCGDSIGCPPVVSFGTDAQKERLLPSVIRGNSRFCLGVIEPNSINNLVSHLRRV